MNPTGPEWSRGNVSATGAVKLLARCNLRMSIEDVTDARHAGRLLAFRHGNSWRYEVSELARFAKVELAARKLRK